MLHDADNTQLTRRVYNIAGFRIAGAAPTAQDIANAVKSRRPNAAPITFKVVQPLLDIIRNFGVLKDDRARDDWGWRGQWLNLETAIDDFAGDVEKYPARMTRLDLFGG
jgi:hypothetical protein